MFLVNAAIPLTFEGSKKLPDGVYEAITRVNPRPQLGELIKKSSRKKQGNNLVEFRGLGECKAAFRGAVLLVEAVIDVVPENKPYIRLIYSPKGNSQVDPLSVNLIFSEEPGNLEEPNYTWRKINA